MPREDLFITTKIWISNAGYDFAEIVPAVNQVETHLFQQQKVAKEDMQKLSALDTGKSLFFSHYDPATVEWFMSIYNNL